ncbi:MAG: hypothetical protein ACE147_04800 [Candidatus Methylomirabilales bacterium]
MSRLPVASQAAAALLLAAACATVPPAPPREDSVLANLVGPDAARDTLRGLANVRVQGPQGGASFAQVVVVDLPDRARLEAQSAVGTTAVVLTLRGEELRYHSYLRHEYAAVPAGRESLERLAGIAVPPGPLLRLLLGLSPLPLRREDPRVTMQPDGEGFRVESVDGRLWQRLWTDRQGFLERGELGEAGETLVAFSLADRRPVDGLLFPFRLVVEQPGGARRLSLTYESLRLNEPIPGDLFELPRPTDGRTRILEPPGGR